jgi:beta-glucosidase
LGATTKPLLADPAYLDQTLSIDERIDDLLSYMTIEEKIGQLALVERNSLSSSKDISTYALGGLLSGSGSKPAENTTPGWREMIDSYQTIAAESRLGIPLLYGTDAIHGHAHVEGEVVFPHQIGLGAGNNPVLVREIGAATARAIKQSGANWNYGPNLDLPQDVRWGRVYEAFSDDPARAADLGAAYIEGLQKTDEASNRIGVLATPKHFIGLGAMAWRTSKNKNFTIDQGVTLPDEKTLQDVYLPPFAAAIDAGALSVMVGLNTWGDQRTIFNKNLLTDTLKGELDFSGFIVSDWYGVYEGQPSTFLANIKAINAGVDMVMLPFDYHSFVREVRLAHRLGLISTERIDDAVRRILRAKFALGLFDQDVTEVSAQDDRALARQAVRESLVLLKNDDVLPLAKSSNHIRVAGSAADNIGQQMGAWSIEWQGVDGNWLPGGISILAGIKDKAGMQARVEYDRTGVFTSTEKADIGIVVVGEKPYAEGWGDREVPILSEEDRQAIANIRQSAEKVIIVVVAGRPLFMNSEINMADAMMMAWLPGSEGQGVADVLFGTAPLRGTLPLPWPRQLEQLPVKTDGTTANGTEVLYPRGFGLTYE